MIKHEIYPAPYSVCNRYNLKVYAGKRFFLELFEDSEKAKFLKKN